LIRVGKKRNFIKLESLPVFPRKAEGRRRGEVTGKEMKRNRYCEGELPSK